MKINIILKTALVTFVASMLVGGALYAASSDSATANSTQTVIASITLTQASDLAFGSGAQNDGAKTVTAGTSDDAETASFTVVGEPSTAFTITVPTNGTVIMETGGGGANETIAVDTFTSNTNCSGTLDGSGNCTVIVGATRAALGAAQVSGAYTDTFTVTVQYP